MELKYIRRTSFSFLLRTAFDVAIVKDGTYLYIPEVLKVWVTEDILNFGRVGGGGVTGKEKWELVTSPVPVREELSSALEKWKMQEGNKKWNY